MTLSGISPRFPAFQKRRVSLSTKATSMVFVARLSSTKNHTDAFLGGRTWD
jgi:hypothetical protein